VIGGITTPFVTVLAFTDRPRGAPWEQWCQQYLVLHVPHTAADSLAGDASTWEKALQARFPAVYAAKVAEEAAEEALAAVAAAARELSESQDLGGAPGDDANPAADLSVDSMEGLDAFVHQAGEVPLSQIGGGEVGVVEEGASAAHATAWLGAVKWAGERPYPEAGDPPLTVENMTDIQRTVYELALAVLQRKPGLGRLRLYVAGVGGTGKTAVLLAIRAAAAAQAEAEGLPPFCTCLVAIMAPTGCGASNAGGSTSHYTLRLPVSGAVAAWWAAASGTRWPSACARPPRCQRTGAPLPPSWPPLPPPSAMAALSSAASASWR
jgi:hypothetical protein